MLSQVSSGQVLRMDTVGDQFPSVPDASPNPVNDRTNEVIFIKGFDWVGVDKTAGTQLILEDLDGNEVWSPSCGTGSETNERIFNVPLRLNGVRVRQIPAGYVLVYKE